QPANYRCTCERMDPAAVFPKVPACQPQMGGSVAKLHHEIGGSDEKVVIKLVDEIQVAIQFVMLPKSPKNKRCFVLLDRHQRSLLVGIPIRMPARSDRSIRFILLEEITVRVNDISAKAIEHASKPIVRG